MNIRTRGVNYVCRSIDYTKDTMSLWEAAAVSAPEMKVRIVKCPMPDSSEIASNATDLGSLEATFYRMAVGQIQYLSHMVRYDVAHAVSRLPIQPEADGGVSSCVNEGLGLHGGISGLQDRRDSRRRAG